MIPVAARSLGAAIASPYVHTLLAAQPVRGSGGRSRPDPGDDIQTHIVARNVRSMSKVRTAT